MNLELKNISYNSRLSQETNAYAADLYLDGKKVASVSNAGHGGCDHQYWHDREAEKKITEYFRAMPKKETGMQLHDKPFMLQPDIEGWCGEQLTDWLILRTVKRAKKVIAIHEGKEVNFKLPAADLDKALRDNKTPRAILAERFPGIVILNGLPDADIVKHLRTVVS